MGADYVVVVDTSSTMNERVSRKDSSIRIKKVQTALEDYFRRLPNESRLYLVSFNTGVIFEREFFVRNDSDRQLILDWVGGLSRDAARGGKTYLCSTVQKALQQASIYAAEHPGEAVRFWALTDGMDNEKGPENQTSERLNKVLDEFPNLDDRSIQADLVILGDLSLTITSKKSWFRTTTDPDFDVVVPPLIQWSPELPKVAETTSFFENSPASYRFYDWRIDNQAAGTTKAVKTRFLAEGTHTIRLIVTTANGAKLEDTKQILVSPLEKPPKPTADFVVYPSSPEPNQEVELIGRSKGKPNRFAWFVNGKLVSHEETNRTVFPNEGSFEVRFHVEGEGGVFDERTSVVTVKEPVLLPRFTTISEAASGHAVQFANQTTGGKPASFAWDFGDGALSAEENPLHTFNIVGSNPREFEIVLRVASRMGKSYTSTPSRLKIWPPGPPPPRPTAAFHPSSVRARVDTLITFLNDSSGLIERTLWQFDREGTRNNNTPEFTFSTPGDKRIVLTVTGPGGSDSCTNLVTVMSREVSILLSWIDLQGKNAPAPKEIDFGQTPPAHAKSGEYAKPPFDSLDVTLPKDLPSDGGLTFELGEKAAKGLILVRHLPNSEQVVAAANPIRESGRYRLMVRQDAPEGEFSDIMTVRARGADVLLNGTNAPLQIPVKLQIGALGGGGLGLFILVLLLAIAVILARTLLNPSPVVDPKHRMETILQELILGKDGKPSAAQTNPPKTFTLTVNQRIYLGHVAHLASTENTFDLGSPRSFLIRQTNDLLLHRAQGSKDQHIRQSGEFCLTDEQGKARTVRLTIRAVAESRTGAAKTPN